MKYNVIWNIRKSNIKLSIICLVLGIGPNFTLFYYLFEEGLEAWFPILLFGFMAFFIDWIFIKCFILIIKPYKSDIFKKYGSLEELEKIMEEIEQSIEYEDSKIIIAKNYVADKKDFEKILAYRDILRVHKLVHKTNFVIDRYDVVITDKYNQEISYSYAVNDEKKVDNLILMIGSKCNNAKIGYTKEAEEHIKSNRKELPKEVEQNTDEKEENINKIYACPDCKEKIGTGDKFCKNCGCKIDWN